MSTRLVAVTLCLLLAAPSFTIAQAPTGSCSTIARDFDRAVDRFQGEARAQGITMVLDEAIQAASDRFVKVLETDPTGKTVVDINKDWNETTEYAERLQARGRDARELHTCLTSSSCNSEQLTRGLNEETRNWVQSFEETSLSRVADRVGKAADFIQTNFQTTFNLSTGIMSRMNGCLTPFRNAQPRVTVTNAETPNVGAIEEPAPVAEPTAKPVDQAAAADPKNGGGNGLLWTTVGLAGLGYAVYEYTGGGSCTEPTTNALSVCSSQGGSSSACTSARAEAAAYCECLGYSGFNASGGGCR